jgi:alkyl sulfatase BDS1-like metallo-beta-lactamase superfamily hydrolase
MPASEWTAQANRHAASALSPRDGEEADARRGLLADGPTGVLRASSGAVVWDFDRRRALDGPPPPSVHPELWRQARLHAVTGLFQVVPGVLQVRGYDSSNITFVRGRDGWVVIDSLGSWETTAAALHLLQSRVDDAPVTAVVLTHSHEDAFGGTAALVQSVDAASGRVPVVAPEGFLEASASEHVLAGNVMARRAAAMFGSGLAFGPEGTVGTGLGLGVSSGRVALVPPTWVIQRSPQSFRLDGVLLEAMLTPDATAPAAMCVYLPAHQVLHVGDLAVRGMHNIGTVRGARVRDALAWSRYLAEAVTRFHDVEVVIGGHSWPTFGHERSIAFLLEQRDLMKAIHDESLRLANHGLPPEEIAHRIELSPGLLDGRSTRQVYGTLRQNARAVTAFYLGPFDSSPTRLDPPPPVEAARLRVDLMGGSDAVVAQLRLFLLEGRYRDAVHILDDVVTADPEHVEGRQMLAEALEQLGFQTESAAWRNLYLTGAAELRGTLDVRSSGAVPSTDMVRRLPTGLLLDALAVRADGRKSAHMAGAMLLAFPETGEWYRLEVSRGAVHWSLLDPADDVDVRAGLALTRHDLDAVLLGDSTVRDLIGGGRAAVEGDEEWVVELFDLLDSFPRSFSLVNHNL